MKLPPHMEEGLLEDYKEKLKLTDCEFDEIINLPKKYYTDFKNYKKTFERMRPLFYLMAKAGFIPWSFYIKYTLPHKVVEEHS